MIRIRSGDGHATRSRSAALRSSNVRSGDSYTLDDDIEPNEIITAILLDVAKRHKYTHVDGACGGGGSPRDLLHKDGGWYEPKYGEGASCYFCHVIVPKSHYDLLPPKRPDEVEQLAQYPFPEDMTDTSRLACQVVLTKEMDGMVIYIPDGPPSDLP